MKRVFLDTNVLIDYFWHIVSHSLKRLPLS